MKSLYLRIWLTVVAALALFALASGWMWQRHLEQERQHFETAVGERLAAWAELVQRALPAADAPEAEQAQALLEWSARLRVPMALDDRRGKRIGESANFVRRDGEPGPAAAAVRLVDGRTLWLARRLIRRAPPPDFNGEDLALWRPGGGMAQLSRESRGPFLGDRPAGPALGGRGAGPAPTMAQLPFGLPRAVGPLLLVALLFVAVAAGAYPVVRRLTRRLEALKQGVQAFGSGNLAMRVDASGSDEVAAVAATFNDAAVRIEALVQSHRSLLANASHELRSPLARLKMAVAMLAEVPEPQRAALKREINTNVAELDALVEEVLLASRLGAGAPVECSEMIDLPGLAAEEAARFDAEVEAIGDATHLLRPGNERLLRRALRNLLENARRYGGADISAQVMAEPDGGLSLRVCDRGPGVPAALRDRIFEPYYRMAGHAEREGGVGLGLSLVRQIAQLHGGDVHCEGREGGGSCFVIRLPPLLDQAGRPPWRPAKA